MVFLTRILTAVPSKMTQKAPDPSCLPKIIIYLHNMEKKIAQFKW